MTVDAVGNLHSTSDGHFAGHIQVEGDADQLLGGIDAQPEPDPGYLIPSWGMEEARARIEKANRSLAKAGIEQRFEATWGEPEYRTEVDEEGREHLEEYRRLTLNHPKISYEGWRFVASLDETDGGMIVRTVPGAELDGYRPEASWCDHCQTHRQRNKTFLVQHEDGTLVQVGSDCIEKFLGVRPKGLAWIGVDLMEGEHWSGGGSRGVEAGNDTRLVVAAAMIASRNGTDYKPSSFGHSTADDVRDILWHTGGSIEQKAARRAAYEQAKALVDSGAVDEVMEAVRSMQGDSDYATNMRTLIENPASRYKHAGYVASAVKVWAKAKEIAVQQRTPRKQGFVAPAGTQLKTLKTADGKAGVAVTVEKMFTSESYFGYNPTLSTRVIMRTEDGQTVMWKASGVPDLKQGEKIRLVGGSVKEHGQWQEQDQTVVTRVKWETDEEAAS